MIQDLNLRMDYQVAVTTSAASTFFIDNLAAGDAMPAGVLAQWKVLIVTTFQNTAGTIQFQLQTSPNSLFDSNAVTLVQTSAILISSLIAQTANIAPQSPDPVIICTPIPSGCLEFLRTYYVVAGNASINAGNVTSEIILDQDKLINANLGFMQR